MALAHSPTKCNCANPILYTFLFEIECRVMLTCIEKLEEVHFATHGYPVFTSEIGVGNNLSF